MGRPPLCWWSWGAGRGPGWLPTGREGALGRAGAKQAKAQAQASRAGHQTGAESTAQVGLPRACVGHAGARRTQRSIIMVPLRGGLQVPACGGSHRGEHFLATSCPEVTVDAAQERDAAD